MTQIEGPHRHAELLNLEHRTDAAATVCAYLITSPPWHPLWSQYFPGVITLADVEGYPPANLRFIGATHELIVYALDPDETHTIESIATTPALRKLYPVNICEQYEATDEEMREVAELACRAVVHGRLNPEVADAPTRIRENWLIAVTKTLAHIRGEEHAP